MSAEKRQDFLRKMLLSSGMLAGFAIAGVVSVALVHEQTKTQILANEQQALVDTLNEVIPASEHDNDLLADRIFLQHEELLGSTKPLPAFRARQDGEAVAVLMEVIAPNGYNGKIRLLVGIRSNGELAAVRVLSHKETPGLGDVIEHGKSDWLEQFPGLSLDKPARENWQVKRDGGAFDQITGATITPRAVVEAVKNALIYFEQHKQAIFSRPAQDGQNGQEYPGSTASTENST